MSEPNIQSNHPRSEEARQIRQAFFDNYPAAERWRQELVANHVHDWKDMTAVGDTVKVEVCWCGARR